MATQPDLSRVVTQLMEALEGIEDGYPPSQPAALNMPEAAWLRMHVNRLRDIARAAIAAAKKEIGG